VDGFRASREARIARQRTKIEHFKIGLLAIKWLERMLWIGLLLFGVFLTIGVFVIQGVGNRAFFVVMAVVCYLAAYLARRFDRYAQDGVQDADRALEWSAPLVQHDSSGVKRTEEEDTDT
jgi:hypothetical protein